MRKLFLYIGVHKTGSTSIQRTLAGIAGRLNAEGYYYPMQSEFNGEVSHAPIAWGLRSGNDSLWQTALTGLKGHHTAVLLHSEEFELFNDEQVQRLRHLLRHFDVRPVLYIRNQIDLLASDYFEWVKNAGYSGEPFVFLRNVDFLTRFNFFQLYARWVAVFGAGNVCLRVFENAVRPPNRLVDDYLQSVGLSQVRPDVEIRDNLKGGLERTLVMRVVSALIDYYAGRIVGEDPQGAYERAKAAVLLETMKRMPAGTPIRRRLLAVEDLKYIIRSFRDSNVALFNQLQTSIPAEYSLDVDDVEALSKDAGSLPTCEPQPDFPLYQAVEEIKNHLSFWFGVERLAWKQPWTVQDRDEQLVDAERASKLRQAIADEQAKVGILHERMVALHHAKDYAEQLATERLVQINELLERLEESERRSS
jgi:hypothetical protein